MRSRGTPFDVGFLLVSLWGQAVAAAAPPQSAQPATTGRVVATITTLEGTVRMPGVQIELRDPDERIVIAKTANDGVGQVRFSSFWGSPKRRQRRGRALTPRLGNRILREAGVE